MQTTSSTKKLLVASMFAALTLLATSVLKIQTPTFGYIHLGDAFVLLSGILLGPVTGGLAAGIGSALSDLLGGYLIFVPGTFLIKFATAACAASLYRLMQHVSGRDTVRMIPSGIAAESVMVAGYFFYNILIVAFTNSGFTPAGIAAAAGISLAEIPFNLIQGVTGLVLSILLCPVLLRISERGSWKTADSAR